MMGMQECLDLPGVGGPGPVPFIQVCDGCGVGWNLGDVLPGEPWTGPVLFGYAALAAHRRRCLGRLTSPCRTLTAEVCHA